jgi:hypothetical protein
MSPTYYESARTPVVDPLQKILFTDFSSHGMLSLVFLNCSSGVRKRPSPPSRFERKNSGERVELKPG